MRSRSTLLLLIALVTVTAGGFAPGESVVGVTADATPSADLFPGGRGAAQFDVSNGSAHPVTLRSVSFGPARSSDEAGCPGHVLRVPSSALRHEIALAAGESERHVVIPAAFALSVRAPDACQGVTFVVPTSVAGVGGTPTTLPATGVPISDVAVVAMVLLGVGVVIHLGSRARRGGTG